MNDGGRSDVVVTNGQGTALKLLGLVAYYDHYWSDKWSSSIGYSRTQVDNLSGQTDGSFKLGQYGSVNLFGIPGKTPCSDWNTSMDRGRTRTAPPGKTTGSSFRSSTALGNCLIYSLNEF